MSTKPVKDALGSLLGYASCPVCGRTAWFSNAFEDWHYISFPKIEPHITRGWYPMCNNCWDTRTPAQRWAAIEDIFQTRATGFTPDQREFIRLQAFDGSAE